MLARGLLRPFVILPLVFIFVLILALYGWPSISLLPGIPMQKPSSDAISSPAQAQHEHIGHPYSGYTEGAYREIFSVSTPDKKYFPIDFSPRRGINPNAIPHPTLKDHWVIVGQLDDHVLEISAWLAELVCTATFKDGALSCIDSPLLLSIGKTPVRAYLPCK
jgi:hypothetical protein